MKRTVFVLVIFGVLHFLPRPCTGGSTNNSRASPWHSSHSATHNEESQKTSSHPNDQKTTVPLSQDDQSEGVTAARQKVKDTEHAGPVLSHVKDIQREEQALDLRLKNDDNETPPIRSYPTNGRTKPKKTMAVVNEADGRSKPKKTMAVVNEADDRSKPKKTMAVVNEADGRSKPKKTMAFWNEADGRSKPKKTMAFWNEAAGRRKPKKIMVVWDQTEGRWKTQDESVTVSQRPLKASIKEDQRHNSIKETLEKGSIKEDPGNGSIKEASGNDSIKEALEKGSIKEDPGNGIIKEDPGNGFIRVALEKVSIKETPGKGSIKETSRKGSIKEAAEKGSIKEAPGKGSVKETLEKGSTKEDPGNGSINEDPENGFIKEASRTGSIKEASRTGSIKEAPEKGSIKETSRKGSIKEASRKGSIKETPGKGSIKEISGKGSIKEAPGKGSIKETPGKGSIKEARGKGSIKEAPGKGSIKETPGKGSIKETPGKGSIKEAQGKGSIKEAPGKGSIKETPGKGSIKEAPGKGSIKEARGKGSIKEARGKGSIKEAPGKGSIKETKEDHIHKDHKEKQAVLTDLKTNIGDTHTAPKLPQNEGGIVQHARKEQNEGGIVQHARKGQNEGGIVQHARKGQNEKGIVQYARKGQNEGGIVQHAGNGHNEHEAVSTSPTKDRFENHPVSQHTQKDENVPGYTPDPWRQDVTGKGTTSSPFQQDQEEMDAVALSLKKNQIQTEHVPHLGKTDGYGNGTALAPFGKEHSFHRVERANNDPDCRCDKCDINAKNSTTNINVAYNKEVTTSSIFRNQIACLFVDGIKTPTIDKTCMHTGDWDLTPWVMVDMEDVYTIRRILITRRKIPHAVGAEDLDIGRLRAIEMKVDGQICHTWPPYSDNSSLAEWSTKTTYDIRCYEDVTGRNIRLEKLEQPGYGWNYHIVFCEVSVLVCTPGYYGATCLPCPSDDQCKYVCNNLYGCSIFEPWNVALKKTATQSSILKGGPGNAVDGLQVISAPEKCTSTNPAIDGTGDRWWQVDMESPYKVFKVFIHTRVDCCANKLDHVDVYVEDEGMETLSSPTKRCAKHRNNTLTEAAVLTLVCDTTKHNRGQFLILVAPSPHLLEFCEVRVMGHEIIEFETGESCADQNELKDCHVENTCVREVCLVNVGGDCTGNYSTFCTDGTICDGGVCKFVLNQDCTGKESLCRFGAACDSRQKTCKWNIRQSCSPGDCISGSTCDAVSKCKYQVGDPCTNSLDCPAGAQCKSSPGGNTCICGGSSGLCDSQVGYAGGTCATGASKCLAPNLQCTDGNCICGQGYTVFSADFTCRVAVNFNCQTTGDCNTGMECVSGTCKLVTGERCTQGADECKSSDVCGSDGLCRVKVNTDCSNHPLLCQSGAICDSGVCKLKAGGTCQVVRGTECAGDTICTANKHNSDTVKRCRLSPGQSCVGTDMRNCEEDSLCDDGVCKLRLESDCAGAKAALCGSGTSCEHSKCKYLSGHDCVNTSQCISTAVCDAKLLTCRAKKGERCLPRFQQCLSGATCMPQSSGGSTCQCTVHPNVNQGSAECEPIPNVVGGSCTKTSCKDPNAFCIKGVCTCGNSRTLEASNYTCGIGPGKDCRNDTSGCNFGTFCDRTGLCLLTVGQSCLDRKQAFCSTGLLCEGDVCKMSLNIDCKDDPDLCTTGTVCGVNKKCKVPQGSNCGDTSVCVSGATCENNTCICTDGISQASGLVCEPLTGKVNGKCTDGTSCDDSQAICNTTANLCKCKEGFAPEPTTQTCGLAKSESCEDNPLLCLTGSECDNKTNTCRLQLGQICDKDMDCVTGTVCDTDSTCRTAFNGKCSPFGSDCASGTFCDSLCKCRLGKAHVCKKTDECSAGALCENSFCACNREFSQTYGVICAPKKGRIGSDCGGVAVCDASLGATCSSSTQKCECQPGVGVLHDFSCEGYDGKKGDPKNKENESAKSNLAVILGSFLGALAFLACCACCCFFVAKRSRKGKKKDLMAERSKSMAGLNELADKVDAHVDEVGGQSADHESHDDESHEQGSESQASHN
ncbi:uncharacterized protein [Littorina saxatilis]|uniref:uncharacterized protein isoform X2 n=1 Tax=Littorina saxatilis TaxID=31220 RepID=UPI0038B4898D